MEVDAVTDREAAHRGRLAIAVFSAARLATPDRLESSVVVCPVRRLTGRPCPGCGLTRAFSWLVRGSLRQAWAHNPLAFPLAALLAGWAVTGRRHADTALDPKRWLRTPAQRLVVGVLTCAWAYWAVRRFVRTSPRS